MDVVVRASTITTAGVCQRGIDASRTRTTLAGGGQTATRVHMAAMPTDGRWKRFIRRLRLEGVSNRSLFIFSEHNFVRKYAKIIIEWGYPLCVCHSRCTIRNDLFYATGSGVVTKHQRRYYARINADYTLCTFWETFYLGHYILSGKRRPPKHVKITL